MENKELEPREVLFKYPQLRHLEIKVGSLEMAAIECAMREYAKEVTTASGQEEILEDLVIIAEQCFHPAKFISAEIIESQKAIIERARKLILK